MKVAEDRQTIEWRLNIVVQEFFSPFPTELRFGAEFWVEGIVRSDTRGRQSVKALKIR
jgi:hypothetical protein